VRSRFSSWSDARRLDFHCGVGAIAFDRSPCGAILDRAKLYAVEYPPGWRERVTAWPTGQKPPSQAVEPDQELAAEYGEIGRRLMRMPPTMSEALRRYHGDDGAHWSMHSRGRMVALFALTTHGRRLMEKERRGADGAQLELSDRKRLANALDADLRNPEADEIRHRLIVLSQRESEKLFSAAERAWKETA
jgi:hypothetical protein